MLKYKFVVAAALAISIHTVACAQQLQAITQHETTRLLQTLSADNMQGRAAFTPAIDSAAAFIAGEFSRIGLEPLPGQQDFMQSFTVYRLLPFSKKASISGKKLPDDAFFVSTTREKLSWQAAASRPVIVIGPKDDFNAMTQKLMQQDTSALVLVNSKHQKSFGGYRDYIAQGSIATTPNAGPDLVFILTNQTKAANYKIEIENTITPQRLTNVVGRIEGKRPDELVVFSGHYDHIGIGHAIDGDSIANGADDDASGTTAVIMLANYYKSQPKPERTLLFIAFTAEEIGGYGSRYFSKQLDPDKIVTMFNIEMVGKTSRFGPNSAFLTGFERSSLGNLMQQRLAGSPYSIHPDPYPEQNLFYRSDNATLARLGVPAHTISSVQIDQDKTYHTVKDEFGNLDMAHMTNMIKLIALASQGVVSGEDTPTRVDKDLVK